MQLTSVTLSITYLILDEKNMNPLVGVTKIINNLQENIEIIDEINKSNNTILPLAQDIDALKNLKKQLFDLINNENFDRLLASIEISKKTATMPEMQDRFLENIQDYIVSQKELIKELQPTLYNSKERIKNMAGDSRIEWFKGWTKNEDQIDLFKGLVVSYSNWEYPIMEIFPGNGDILQFALGGEPLYIVDWDDKLIEKVGSQFNEYYANKRLMKYKIENFNLSQLPQKSFGFIYCINYLNFENLENLLSLAENVYQCLMDGGTYIFVYNNAEDWWSVRHAVETFMGLVDTEELSAGLKKIGFSINQIVKSEDLKLSYIICQKPGDITYLKGSSVLGKIIDKSDDML